MQPLVFKKQIISLVTIGIFFLIVFNISSYSHLLYPMGYYFLIIFSMTILPSLKRILKYNKYIHSFLFSLPYIIPIIIHDLWKTNGDNLKGIVIGTIYCTLMILVNIKYHIKSFKNNVSNSLPLALNVALFENYLILLSVICEELFFRVYLVGYFSNIYGYKTIVISTIMFVYAHAMNRWSSEVYNIRSYIWQGILSLVLGIIYYRTRSFIGCLIGHMIFNSPRFFTIYFRTFFVKRKIFTFDDY